MPITPDDINNIRFDLTKKGYATEQVDAFIDRIAGEIDLLSKEIDYMRQQNNELLVTIEALKTREVAIEQSIVEASNLRNEIIDKANLDAKKIMEDATEMVADQQKQLELLKQEEEQTIKRIRYIIESQLANLEYVIGDN